MADSCRTRPLTEIGIGDHLCLVYESDAERLDAVVPFLEQGLARNECCLCFADAATAAQVSAALTTAGVDVADAQQRAALTFVTERAYLRDGRFEPQALLVLLQQTVAQAVAAGFSGWRATGDMLWELGPVTPFECLVEYEASLDAVFPGKCMVGMCQYHRFQVPPAVLRHALRTHRHVVLGGMVCPNPYYEPPALLGGDGGEAERVEWMLAQLARTRDAEALREQAVRDQTARAGAELAVQLRDDFLASVSHDLQNPLGLIRNQTQLLRRRLDRGDDLDADRLRTGLVRIEDATRRAGALIGELLDVARLEGGQALELARQPTDLVALTRQTVAMAQSSSRRSIDLTCDEPSLDGDWDAARLERVLANLLSNAAKYSAGDGRIRVRVAQERAFAVLTVEDDGMGIPAADVPHIFERFHRGENVAGRVRGTGLGLAGAHAIVAQHGGTIAVESVEGSGTTLTLRLSLADTPALVDAVVPTDAAIA